MSSSSSRSKSSSSRSADRTLVIDPLIRTMTQKGRADTLAQLMSSSKFMNTKIKQDSRASALVTVTRFKTIVTNIFRDALRIGQSNLENTENDLMISLEFLDRPIACRSIAGLNYYLKGININSQELKMKHKGIRLVLRNGLTPSVIKMEIQNYLSILTESELENFSLNIYIQSNSRGTRERVADDFVAKLGNIPYTKEKDTLLGKRIVKITIPFN